MGGEGSGRKPSTETLMARYSNQSPAQTQVGTGIFLPDFSGVPSNPKVKDAFVNVTGDTMTGSLVFSAGSQSIGTIAIDGDSLTISYTDTQDTASVDITKDNVAVTGTFQCDGITNDTGLAHGTYTPTLTNVANLDASTAYDANYLRVGNVVTVSGKVDLDPTTTSTLTQIGISLPIASNLATNEQCSGVSNCASAAVRGGVILGDATNDRAQMDVQVQHTSNQSYYFTFTYLVI